MTANTAMQMTRKSGPCGCGGSGATMTSPCTCGGVGCSLCQNPGYVRPRFFAGQLLTDEDLQLLGDYVLGKNRLRNRYVVGSGVVCGLEVTCPPCGGGTVTVNPGYAIDCCGNDIVLPCPQLLDINKMIRDLRLKMTGGIDCGDPCADAGTSGTSPGGTGMFSSSGSGNGKNGTKTSAGGTDTTTTPEAARKYCLYVDYCEQPTDPVSPYATDDPCGPQTCEPTRIREGFHFELRCPEAEEPHPEICGRFWGCVGDLTAVERALTESRFLGTYGRQLRRAAIEIRETPMPVIPKRDTYVADLKDHIEALAVVLHELKELRVNEVKEVRLEKVFDSVVVLASDIALFKMQTNDVQEGLFRSNQSLLEQAETALNAAVHYFTPERINQVLPATLKRAYASALFEVIQKLLPQMPKRDLPKFDQMKEMYVRFMVQRTVFNASFQSAGVDSLRAIRDWLLCRLEQAPSSTDCDLLEQVKGLSLPSQSSGPDVSGGDATAFAQASIVLVRAVLEFLRSCFCNALNPPCPSCDDMGVLLACLTVKDCEVKDICNLERDFALTPLAIRYWIPEIEKIGDSIEKWCCASLDACEEDKGFPIAVELALLAILAACPDPYKSLKSVREYSVQFLTRSIAKLRAVAAVSGIFPAAEAAPATVDAAVQAATADLKEKLGAAHSELEKLRIDFGKLLDRVAKLEKRRGSEG